MAVSNGSSGTKYGDWIQARSRAVVSATTKTSRMVGKGVDTLEWRTCTGIPSPAVPVAGSAQPAKRSSSRPFIDQVAANSWRYGATTGPVIRKCVSRQVSKRRPPSTYSCPMFMPPE